MPFHGRKPLPRAASVAKPATMSVSVARKAKIPTAITGDPNVDTKLEGYTPVCFRVVSEHPIPAATKSVIVDLIFKEIIHHALPKSEQELYKDLRSYVSSCSVLSTGVPLPIFMTDADAQSAAQDSKPNSVQVTLQIRKSIATALNEMTLKLAEQGKLLGITQECRVTLIGDHVPRIQAAILQNVPPGLTLQDLQGYVDKNRQACTDKDGKITDPGWEFRILYGERASLQVTGTDCPMPTNAFVAILHSTDGKVVPAEFPITPMPGFKPVRITTFTPSGPMPQVSPTAENADRPMDKAPQPLEKSTGSPVDPPMAGGEGARQRDGTQLGSCTTPSPNSMPRSYASALTAEAQGIASSGITVTSLAAEGANLESTADPEAAAQHSIAGEGTSIATAANTTTPPAALTHEHAVPNGDSEGTAGSSAVPPALTPPALSAGKASGLAFAIGVGGDSHAERKKAGSKQPKPQRAAKGAVTNAAKQQAATAAAAAAANAAAANRQQAEGGAADPPEPAPNAGSTSDDGGGPWQQQKTRVLRGKGVGAHKGQMHPRPDHPERPAGQQQAGKGKDRDRPQLSQQSAQKGKKPHTSEGGDREESMNMTPHKPPKPASARSSPLHAGVNPFNLLPDAQSDDDSAPPTSKGKDAEMINTSPAK